MINLHITYFVLILFIGFTLLVIITKKAKASFFISLISAVLFTIFGHGLVRDEVTLNKINEYPGWTFRTDLPLLRLRYHKLVNLCEKYSVNEIYDEKEFDRYKRISGYSPYSSENNPDYEPYKDLKDVNEIKKIMSTVGEKYNPEENANYGLREKNGFITYFYSFKPIGICKTSDCNITERKLFNLNTKKLIAHVKDFDGNVPKKAINYNPGCLDLKVGKFKNSSWKF